MAVEAELKRRNDVAALVDWLLATDPENAATGFSDPVVDYGTRSALAAILMALESVLSVQGTVDVGNQPNDFPDEAVLGKLEEMRALLAGIINVGGTVDVGNLPADYPDEALLAKLELVRLLLDGTLTVAGTVNVGNLPASTEISNDAGNPVPVSVEEPVTVDGFPADQKVHDDYASESHAADQGGAGAVLTFTVAAGSMVIVDVDNTTSDDYATYRARATVDGTNPSATSGFVCRSGQSTYLPVSSAGTVKVYAPANTVVAVQSLGR